MFDPNPPNAPPPLLPPDNLLRPPPLARLLSLLLYFDGVVGLAKCSIRPLHECSEQSNDCDAIELLDEFLLDADLCAGGNEEAELLRN